MITCTPKKVVELSEGDKLLLFAHVESLNTKGDALLQAALALKQEASAIYGFLHEYRMADMAKNAVVGANWQPTPKPAARAPSVVTNEEEV